MQSSVEATHYFAHQPFRVGKGPITIKKLSMVMRIGNKLFEQSNSRRTLTAYDREFGRGSRTHLIRVGCCPRAGSAFRYPGYSPVIFSGRVVFVGRLPSPKAR